MERKDPEEIRNYWEGRARNDSSAQSTTMDIWLRDIESSVVSSWLEKIKPSEVFDIGCGDGRTTIKGAIKYPSMRFTGLDYADNMILNAKRNASDSKVGNVEFMVADITNNIGFQKCDFAYTTRCLINLADWGAQKHAIGNISNVLAPGGVFLMIENFIEGHLLFNSLRAEFDLPEIPVRSHNTFFSREPLFKYLENYFDVLFEENISSTYYIVSRILYASICKAEGITPDYNDIHHQLAASLPFLGEYGPVRVVALRKK